MVETTTRPIAGKRDVFSFLLFRTCWVGLLLGVSASVFFLFGLGGYVGSGLLQVFTAASVIFAALFFIWSFFANTPSPTQSPLGISVWLVILLVLLLEVLLSQVPPVARDELTHHLAIPRQYARMGRISEIPFAPYSYYPMLLDMLYTPWVGWGWDSVPKIIHGLFGFLTGLLLFAYLGRRLSPFYGLLGFLVFISTPMILRLANLAYVDLGVSFYTTASLLCLLRWRETPEDLRWLGMGGLTGGFVMATKPNGLLALFLIGFIFIFFLAREDKLSLSAKVGCGALFSFLAILPFLPWALKNIAQTGNPFFPLLGGLLELGEAGESGKEGAGALSLFARRGYLYGENWWEIVLVPLRIFFVGKDDVPQYFDGVLNPILVLFLPWAFKGKWFEEKVAFFLFAILYLLYAYVLVEMRIRYVLPVVSPLAIIATYAIHNVYLRIARPAIVWTVVILLLSWNGIYLWNYARKVSPVAFALGKESREEYLVRMLPEYPVIRYVNGNLSESARIYFIFMGRRVYYCNCDYFHDGGDNPWVLLQSIQKSAKPVDVREQLRKRELTHFLTRLDLLERFLRNNLSHDEQRLWNGFAIEFLQELYRYQNYGVYKING